jgi:TfoX/Sxy family transcriptional regulator of competence genes
VAYDEALADRVRAVLEGRPGLAEQSMFGGLAFLIDRLMCCGIVGDELLVRLGAEGSADALANQPHTRPMDFTGKTMRNFVFVTAPGVRTDGQLRRWLELALAALGANRPAARQRGSRARAAAASRASRPAVAVQPKAVVIMARVFPFHDSRTTQGSVRIDFQPTATARPCQIRQPDVVNAAALNARAWDPQGAPQPRFSRWACHRLALTR